jgi:hypothetical protein
MDNNIYIAQFSAGEIAKALGVDMNLLQNWLRRAKNLEPQPTVGGRRLFSAAFAFELAKLKELNVFGMGPVQASDAMQRSSPLRDVDFAAALTGDKYIVLRPVGGNAEGDMERGNYIFSPVIEADKDGYLNFRLGGEPSGLILALTTIARKLEAELQLIVWARSSSHAV